MLPFLPVAVYARPGSADAEAMLRVRLRMHACVRARSRTHVHAYVWRQEQRQRARGRMHCSMPPPVLCAVWRLPVHRAVKGLVFEVDGVMLLVSAFHCIALLRRCEPCACCAGVFLFTPTALIGFCAHSVSYSTRRYCVRRDLNACGVRGSQRSAGAQACSFPVVDACSAFIFRSGCSEADCAHATGGAVHGEHACFAPPTLNVLPHQVLHQQISVVGLLRRGLGHSIQVSFTLLGIRAMLIAQGSAGKLAHILALRPSTLHAAIIGIQIVTVTTGVLRRLWFPAGDCAVYAAQPAAHGAGCGIRLRVLLRAAGPRDALPRHPRVGRTRC